SLLLSKNISGQRSVLASAPLLKPARAARMEVRCDEGAIELSLDGQPMLSAHDTDLPGGKIALLARKTEFARFDNVTFRQIPPLKPLLSFHETFSQEISMSEWSSGAKDWDVEGGKAEGGSVTNATCWHRACLPGDTRVELRLPKPLPQGAAASVVISARGQMASAGYRLTLSAQEKPADGATHALTLQRQGKDVASAPVTWADGPQNLALARFGSIVAASLGGRQVLRFDDTAPLVGNRAGFAAKNCQINFSDFNIYTRNVLDYTFQSAPVDWRAASGEWDVTNRWQCDPRWSFFSGVGQGVVAIWNKRSFEGDVTLEFFCGIKMDRDRGTRYEYASDMNATICADGNDLNTGYSFVFGGNKNTATRLYRQNVVLAENTSFLINPRTHHRHWYHIRVSKRGKHLEMQVDGERVLSVEDPKPLTGDRIALWTRDNGIMIGRARISADTIGPRESPDVNPPTRPASVYRN
ncbi:MAG TPA: hypothetical protein P5137_14115, partial [Candidatus Brocadiia bacterium]|nr:hypothetical protein [Candidatus Brocadiia bacterium]